MTDDTRSRWEKWRRDYAPHHWTANYLRRKGSVSRPLSSLTLTVQGTYPERVLVTLAGLTSGQLVRVTRTAAGSTTRTAVRGLDRVTVTSDALVKVDAEAPFGVELTYILSVDNSDIATATATLALAGGKVALSDAISGDAAECVILSWPSKRRERASSVFAIGGRNVVVTGQLGGFSGTIELFTETTDSKENILDLLDSATSGVIQIRQAGPYDGVDCYVAVLSFDETRYSQDGSDERRVLSLDVAESTPWGPSLESATSTYQDLIDAYAGQNYANLAADYATYLDLAGGVFL